MYWPVGEFTHGSITFLVESSRIGGSVSTHSGVKPTNTKCNPNPTPRARRTTCEGLVQAQERWNVRDASSQLSLVSTLKWDGSNYVTSTWPGDIQTNSPSLPKIIFLWTQNNCLEQTEISFIFCNWHPGTKEKWSPVFLVCSLPTSVSTVKPQVGAETRRKQGVWKLLHPLKWLKREQACGTVL